MKTRCLLVDDEPLALDIIESYLSRFESIEIVARCENAIDAVAVLHSKPVDLLFLDIQMPRLTGLDFLKTLKNPPKTIITTAYREYALEGYDLDVIDYLLKPIAFERFVKAINKFYQLTETVVAASNADTSGTHQLSSDCEYILVKGNRKVHRIELTSILLIESMEDYVKFVIVGDKTIVVKQQIGILEELLPTNLFVRIHRSFIVSVKHIDGFTGSTIEIGNRELPIGRNYKPTVFKILKYNEPL